MAAATAKVRVNGFTGLTSTQERACSLLASGATTEAVAAELSIPEQTLYLWQKQSTFECYYNKRRSVIRNAAVQSLFGLVDEATTAIRESLSSENESVRLKAATYIIDKLQKMDVGKTDILEVVKQEATYCNWGVAATFHKEDYKERLKELGVQEQDYQKSLQ